MTARPGEDVVVLSDRQRADAGPASGRRARPACWRRAAARDAQRARRAGSDARRRGGQASRVPTQLGWPGSKRRRTRGSTRGWMGQALLSGFEVADRPRARTPAAKLRRRGGDQESRRQGRRRRLPPLGRRAPSRSRAAGASSTRCLAADDGRPLLVLRPRHVRPTRSAPSPSSGRCTTRPCASCSRAMATASTASTIRPSARARSPTR